MPRMTLAKSFENVVGKALATRKDLAAQIAKLQTKLDDIEAMFAAAGLDLAALRTPLAQVRRGRKPGTKGKRGKFSQTGEAFILDLVKDGPLPTQEINAAWKKEGRGGVAGPLLSKMAAEKKLKSEKMETGKGRRYSVS